MIVKTRRKRRAASVSGISGFVGSYLAKFLSSTGWNVSGYDVHPLRVECDFYSDDLSDVSAIETAVKKSAPDVIFHLAGILKSSSSEEFDKVHILGTISLLEAVLGVGRLIPLPS